MRKFLAAEWRYLAMLNYPVEAQVLQPLVPSGTELDTWNGTPYVSMVGFLFLNTRVLGAAIPFHTNFEEVNLRFYVRRKAEDGWRRGVVFVHEIVPRWAIAFVARTVYSEKYLAMPMRHHFGPPEQPMASAPASPGMPAAAWSANQAADSVPLTVEYSWRFHGRWNRLALTTCGASDLAREGSEEQFITEHYWGYAATREGGRGRIPGRASLLAGVAGPRPTS